MHNPRLDTLQKLRDRVLAKSAAGKKIINAYYTGSAKVIPVLDKHPDVKKAARIFLEGLIPIVKVLMK